MSTTISEIWRELFWLRKSRALVLTGAVLILVIGTNVVAQLTNAQSSVALFKRTAENLQAEGGNLSDALSSEVIITDTAEGRSIDNVVRYDFEAAGAALSALTPTGFASATMTIMFTLIFPFLLLSLGVFLATHDFASKVARVRFVRINTGTIVLAKAATLIVFSVLAVIFTVALSLIAGLVAQALAIGIEQREIFAVVPTDTGNLFLQALAVLAVGLYWGILGLAIGLCFLSRIIPIVLAGLFLFAVPFLGALDPRVLMVSLGKQVLFLGGAFELRVMDTGPPGPAMIVWISFLLLAVIAALLIFRRRSKFPEVKS